MYTYDVSRMTRYTLLFVSLYYFYMPVPVQSVHTSFLYVLTYYRISSKYKMAGPVNFTSWFYSSSFQPRCYELVDYLIFIMTSFCHIYISLPRSTNRVNFLRHTSTNRVTISRHTHNHNNNIFPSVYYFHTNLFCLK